MNPDKANLILHRIALWASYSLVALFVAIIAFLAVWGDWVWPTGLWWLVQGCTGVGLSLWLAGRMKIHVRYYRLLLSLPAVPRRAVVAVILASGARVRIGEPDSYEMNGHQ